MRIATLALTGLVVALLGAPAFAQSRLEASSGRVYEGKILSDDGTTVEIETTQGTTLKLPYAQLTPMTQYRLHRDRAAADGRGQLELAEWCVDQTLYQEAKRHYRAALDADAGMSDAINESIGKARTRAANELLDRARALQESGRPKEARQLVATIIQELPLEEAATEAAHLLAEETERRKQSSLSRSSTRASGADAPPVGERAKRPTGEAFSDEAYKTMAPVIDAYKKILDRTHAGLQASNEGTSIKEYEKGLSEGDKARKTVEKLRPQGRENDELAEACELADAKLEEAIVDCRLFLVDAYLLRTSYKQAGEVVKQGLATYPRNERLRRASERVVAAANNNDGGGWVIGGRAVRIQRSR